MFVTFCSSSLFQNFFVRVLMIAEKKLDKIVTKNCHCCCCCFFFVTAFVCVFVCVFVSFVVVVLDVVELLLSLRWLADIERIQGITWPRPLRWHPFATRRRPLAAQLPPARQAMRIFLNVAFEASALRPSRQGLKIIN